MRKILNFINHNVVNLWPCISSKSDEIKDIVDCVHNIVSSSFQFPSFVLAKSLINIFFFSFGEKNVGRIFQINFLGEILSRVEMSSCWTFDTREYLSPNKMWSNVLLTVVHFLDIGPKVCREIIKINLKWKFWDFLFLKFFCDCLFILILPELNLTHVLMFQLFLVWIVDLFLHLFNYSFFIILFIVILTFVVVLDHHDSLLLIVPGCLSLLLN